MNTAFKGRKPTAKPAYLKFTGDMLDAFLALVDAMDKKGSDNLVTLGKFTQTYREGANELKTTPDLNATDYSCTLANDIANKMADITSKVAVGRLEKPMKDIIDICSKYLAQNAEYNKEKGPAFRYLLKKMWEIPNELLCSKGKILKTTGIGAEELNSAKGLETDHDDPRLTEIIRAALENFTKDLPAELMDDMPETIKMAARYLSQKTADDSERGPAFDKLISILQKKGGKPFSPENQGLKTAFDVAYALENAPGLKSCKPDPVLDPIFKKILHQLVDPDTSSDMMGEMDDVISVCAAYLSGLARDRLAAQALMVKTMNSDKSKEAAKRNNVGITYGQAAEEFERAPVMTPLLPVRDVAQETTTLIRQDMKDLTPPELKGAVKVITKDAGGDLSQDVALMSGVAGERYGRNLVAATADVKGDEQLFKYGPYGMSYGQAGETLRNAGTLEKSSKADVMPLTDQINHGLRDGVDDRVIPATANRLQPTTQAAAEHLAKVGAEKGAALTFLLDAMMTKKDEQMAPIQGMPHTNGDCVKKIARAPTLRNDHVDRQMQEVIALKLKDLMAKNPSPEHEKIMPAIIDEVSRFLAKAKPESEEEQKDLMHDLLTLKGSSVFFKDGKYVMTFGEAGNQIQNTPTGIAAKAAAGGPDAPPPVDPIKQKQIYEKLERVIDAKIPDRALREQMKGQQLDDEAYYLGEVSTGRAEALDAIHKELTAKGDPMLAQFRDGTMTYGEGATAIDDSKSLEKRPAPPGLSEDVNRKIAALPVTTQTVSGANHAKSTVALVADYIAAETGVRGGYVPPAGSEGYKPGAGLGGAGAGAGGPGVGGPGAGGPGAGGPGAGGPGAGGPGGGGPGAGGAGAYGGADGTGTGAGGAGAGAGAYGAGGVGAGAGAYGAGAGAGGVGAGAYGAGAGAGGVGAGAYGAGAGGPGVGGFGADGTGAGGAGPGPYGTGPGGIGPGAGAGGVGTDGTGAGGPGAGGYGPGAGGYGPGAGGYGPGAGGYGPGAGGYGPGAGGYGPGAGGFGPGAGAGGLGPGGLEGAVDAAFRGFGTGGPGAGGPGAGGYGTDGTGAGGAGAGAGGLGADGTGAYGAGAGGVGPYGTGAGADGLGAGAGAGGVGVDGTGAGGYGAGAGGVGAGTIGAGAGGVGAGAGGAGAGLGTTGFSGAGAGGLSGEEAERARRLSEMRKRVASGEKGGVQDKDHEDAKQKLIEMLKKSGKDVFYRQSQIGLVNEGAADVLQKDKHEVDKAIRDSAETDKLARKFERKLAAFVESNTPPHLRDAMNDVIIESARPLAEYFIEQTYAAAVRENLIDAMQKKDNEFLDEEDGDAETFFYAAQRLKKAKMLASRDSHGKLTREINKKIDESLKGQPIPRKLANTMREHAKHAASYLSEHVLQPDPEIDAFIALLMEMEDAGDAPLEENIISFKDAAKYLKHLTSFEDKIGKEDKELQAKIMAKMTELMANVPLEGYTDEERKFVIEQQAILLTSYLLAQAEKKDALKQLIERMEQTPDSMILRHGKERKSFFDATELLREKSMADIQSEKEPDPVVARKIQIKLNNTMAAEADDGIISKVMSEVIADVANYLAVHLLHPQIIKVCKCMKSVFIQCELWAEEILRRVARPRCTCSQGRLMEQPGAFTTGIQIDFKECPTMATHMQDGPRLPCPATSAPCPAAATTSYLVQAEQQFEPARPLSPPRRQRHRHPAVKATPGSQLATAYSTMGQVSYSSTRITQDMTNYSMVTQGTSRNLDTTMSFNSTLAVPSSSVANVRTRPRFPQSPWTMFAAKLDSRSRDVPPSEYYTPHEGGHRRRRKRNDVPLISTGQTSDLYAMILSLTWNVQAWRDWLQDNFNYALADHTYDPTVPPDAAYGDWITFKKKIMTEALQWRQYVKFSVQLTLRLEQRYRQKMFANTREAAEIQSYLRCQREMLEISDMFSKWTHWLMAVFKETETITQDPNDGTPLHVLCLNYLKTKVWAGMKDWTVYKKHLNIFWEHKYTALMTAWERKGPVWVMSAYGAVPSGAVSAGKYADEVIWVARTTHNSDILPGALVPSKHSCVIYSNGAVINCTKYQVLCNASVQWISWRAGLSHSPTVRAVCVAPGVHVGRVDYHGHHLVGAVLAPNNCCEVVINSRSYNYDSYELLVLLPKRDV